MCTGYIRCEACRKQDGMFSVCQPQLVHSSRSRSAFSESMPYHYSRKQWTAHRISGFASLRKLSYQTRFNESRIRKETSRCPRSKHRRINIGDSN
jgi:hypothetical protein